jgi:hypothetical protein
MPNIKLTLQNRIGVALALVWSVVTSVFYFNTLGFYAAGDYVYENLPEPLAFWARFCGKLDWPTFNVQVGEPKLADGFYTWTNTLAFDSLGFVVFVFVPLGAWLALLLLLHWVVKAVSKDQKS